MRRFTHSSTSYRLACVLVLFGLLLAVPVSSGAEDHPDDTSPRTITVSGEGTASSAPDMATISTGVVTQAKEAKQALDANNQAMDRVMQVLEDQGIASKDIQTSQFNVQPVHETDERGRRQPDIVAYRVNNSVQVHVRNLPKLGEVLDALVEAGSNEISGISFGVADESGLLNEARSRAVADAKSQAAVFAQAAGVKVGPVRSIRGASGSIPMPRQSYQMARAAADRVPVATGELDFRVTVQMVFDLTDRE